MTGTAPLTLLTRRQNCVPPELLQLVNFDNTSIDADAMDRHVQLRMTELSAKDKARFDRGRAKIHSSQRGDFVLIKNNPRNRTSLDLKFSVPYEVYRVLDHDRNLVKKVVGHHGRPRKVAHDQLRRAPQPAGGPQVAVSPRDVQQRAGPSGVACATPPYSATALQAADVTDGDVTSLRDYQQQAGPSDVACATPARSTAALRAADVIDGDVTVNAQHKTHRASL